MALSSLLFDAEVVFMVCHVVKSMMSHAAFGPDLIEKVRINIINLIKYKCPRTVHGERVFIDADFVKSISPLYELARIKGMEGQSVDLIQEMVNLIHTHFHQGCRVHENVAIIFRNLFNLIGGEKSKTTCVEFIAYFIKMVKMAEFKYLGVGENRFEIPLGDTERRWDVKNKVTIICGQAEYLSESAVTRAEFSDDIIFTSVEVQVIQDHVSFADGVGDVR